MGLIKNALKAGLLASITLVNAAPAQHGSRLSKNAQEMLDQSMKWMDTLYELGATSALRHNTRHSTWYALGLLARNEHDDVEEAEKIIGNVIGAQFKDPSEQWYVR
jgi:hypothetical protein